MAKRPRIKWDDEKDDALKTLVDNDYDDGEIADHFGLESEYQIKRRRYKLGILRRSARGGNHKWSEEHIQYLRETMHLKAIEVAKYIGKTQTAVEQKRSELGLKSTIRNTWQPWQLKIMETDYSTKGAHYVAAKTGWSKPAIWAKAFQLGLVREKR